MRRLVLSLGYVLLSTLTGSAEPIDWLFVISPIGVSISTKDSTRTSFVMGVGSTFDLYYKNPVRSWGFALQGETEFGSSFLRNKASFPLTAGPVINVKGVLRLEPGIGSRFATDDQNLFTAKYKEFLNGHMGVGWYPSIGGLLKLSYDVTPDLDLQVLKLSYVAKIHSWNW